MSSPQKVLFMGATGTFVLHCNFIAQLTERHTGYIGGPVLGKLLRHPRATSLHITAFVRDPTKAEKFEAFGVTPVIGDNSNLELLQELGRNADVVFSVASAFLFKVASRKDLPVDRCHAHRQIAMTYKE
jgi:uncharacterized protein YbjT (DUF2867 family)